MEEDVNAELLLIVRPLEFPTPGIVSLAGRTAPAAATANPAPGVMPVPANHLVAQLQQLLYDWCYCRRFDPAPAQAKAGASGDPRFVESLSAVNASHDRWDAGWRILQTMPSGQF